jgi:hypothetical protein
MVIDHAKDDGTIYVPFVLYAHVKGVIHGCDRILINCRHA